MISFYLITPPYFAVSIGDVCYQAVGNIISHYLRVGMIAGHMGDY